MRKLDIARLALLAVAIVIFLLPKQVEGPFTVVDGDTLKKEGTYYRAYYVDAPELSKQKPWVLSELPDEECLKRVAISAKLFVSSIGNVALKGKKDKYGRELGEFLLPDGASAEMAMVELGLARCYYREVKLEDPRTYECLEKEALAKNSSLGMWACT